MSFTVNKNWSPTCSQPLKGTGYPTNALLLSACQVTFQREETDVVKPLASANSRKLLGLYRYSLPFHSIEAEMTRCDLIKIMMPHLVLQHFSWALLEPGFAGVSTTTLWNLIGICLSLTLTHLQMFTDICCHSVQIVPPLSPPPHITPHYILLNKLCTIPLRTSLYMLVKNNICPVSYSWHLAELYGCMHAALSSSSPYIWYLQKIRICSIFVLHFPPYI